MEVKFGNAEGTSVVEKQTVETPVEGVKVETTNTYKAPPATVTEPATQAVTTTGPGVFRLGDRLPGFKDVILPRFNIVQNVGDLKDQFAPGALVFNKDTVLYTPPVIDQQKGVITKPGLPPVTLYVIGIVSERFSEKIKGGIGGEIVDTEAEVRAAGGTLDYKEWELKQNEGMRRFEPLIDLLVAIEKPEHISDDGTVFGFPVGKKHFTIGFWGCKGTSYTHAVKKVFNLHRLTGVLRGGYYTHSFNVTTRIENNKKQGFSYWVPVCTPKEKTSPEVLEFIRGIVGQ